MNDSIKRYYLIDHKILFLLGYIFYLWIPYWLGAGNAFKDYPGVDLFQRYFVRIAAGKIHSYVLITLSWLPAFYLGHFAFKLITPYKRSLRLYPATAITYSASYIGIMLCCVLLLFVYMSRGAILGSFDNYDVGPRGKLTTLMMIFNFFLLYQLVSRQKPSVFLATGTILTSLILLLSGGRLTPLQSFLVYLIYKTSFAEKRWKLSHIAIFAVIGFLAGALIGLWRVRAGFSLEHAGFSLFAEPLFSWFSTCSFLASNDIPSINVPTNFITSFINLIPNTIINVHQYIVPVSGMGYSYVNPFGADSIWTSLVINFGAIGSFIFIFFTGFILSMLRHISENSRFWAVYYILVCAMLPFEFFRTGFFILNKELFFNFLFLPVVIGVALKILLHSQKTEKALT